jgi:hypothetical protein
VTARSQKISGECGGQESTDSQYEGEEGRDLLSFSYDEMACLLDDTPIIALCGCNLDIKNYYSNF